MSPVTPVTITIDGVERELRFTQGAALRITKHFGMPMREALNKYDAGAFPAILHALMHDRKGNPPDVSIEELAEMLPMDASAEVLAAIVAASNQGRIPKEQIEAQIVKAMEQEATKNGFAPGLSAVSDFDSLTASSGGDTVSPKSTLSPTNTETNSESGTPVAA